MNGQILSLKQRMIDESRQEQVTNFNIGFINTDMEWHYGQILNQFMFRQFFLLSVLVIKI